MFGNILDNAIESAEFSGAEHETAKQIKREHGYGLKNIQQIVDKYDSMMQRINEKNNMFCCDVLL